MNKRRIHIRCRVPRTPDMYSSFVYFELVRKKLKEIQFYNFFKISFEFCEDSGSRSGHTDSTVPTKSINSDSER